MSDYPIVRVFTFKDGLLSRFAHDLQLAVTRFEIELANEELDGRFHLDSLVVEGAVRDGKLDPKALSASDCQKILRTAAKDVLKSDRFPQARLEAALHVSGDQVHVDGTLTLLGRRLALPKVQPVHVGTAWIADFQLVPSRWGIRPYRAIGGALKIQDRIRLEVALPSAGDEQSLTKPDASHRWRMNAGGQASEVG